ncbi:MAG: alpha-glucan family phosphorylase [Myxococcota bacterium]
MKTIYKFNVTPSLPPKLKRLKEIASNLWWCWNYDAIELFLRMDSKLWEKVGHNPVELLGKVSQQRLQLLSEDDAYLHSLSKVLTKFDKAMESDRKFPLEETDKELSIAYFSLEYGLHECLPIYSGGLGVLSGEHLKSSSDLGIPLVGMGLLYREGYFNQYLNPDGWQQETYPENDFHNMCINPVLDKNGEHLEIEVEMPTEIIHARIWLIKVGKTNLFLLDTNIEKNSIDNREITAQLYGGYLEMRLKQEYVLGMGGINAFAKLGITPTVYHMNEGHSAFLGLKRIKILMQEHGLNFQEAKEACSCCNVFTTHTPVPAGIDKFPPALMDKYFWKYREKTGLSREEFLQLGRENPKNNTEPFSLAVLAIKLSDHYNGVSKLHGKVSRDMWKNIWKNIPQDEVPIQHVTNGIHNKSWVSHELASLFDRYLGPKWQNYPENKETWSQIDQIPDAELWRTHERRRERLVSFIRKRRKNNLMERGVSKNEIQRSEELLHPDILTIGFARRFATYKRATLLFKNIDRLIGLMTDQKRPFQLIFAGKAHPQDNQGKGLIREIVHHIKNENFLRRVVFIENYDLNVARYMLQGVDVWLNNPRRPLEASGTSGMKASANGGLNLSILDGWWVEGYTPDVGWAIGHGEEYTDLEYQDEVESRELYSVLEKEIIPAFYERGKDGIPRKWTFMMKETFKNIAPFFNTNRMVNDYAQKFYLPSHRRWKTFKENSFKTARELTTWKNKVKEAWKNVNVVDVKSEIDGPELIVGNKLEVEVKISLGSLDPEDVKIQLLYGNINQEEELLSPTIKELAKVSSQDDNNNYIYKTQITCENSGSHGYAIRIIPYHPQLSHIHETRLIRWG